MEFCVWGFLLNSLPTVFCLLRKLTELPACKVARVDQLDVGRVVLGTWAAIRFAVLPYSVYRGIFEPELLWAKLVPHISGGRQPVVNV